MVSVHAGSNLGCMFLVGLVLEWSGRLCFGVLTEGAKKLEGSELAWCHSTSLLQSQGCCLCTTSCSKPLRLAAPCCMPPACVTEGAVVTDTVTVSACSLPHRLPLQLLRGLLCVFCIRMCYERQLAPVNVQQLAAANRTIVYGLLHWHT